MGFALRQDVYYCIANRKVALLDLRSDALFSLPPAADGAFQRLVENSSATGADTDALSSLLRRGLLVETEGDGFDAPRPLAAIPLNDLRQDDLPKARLTDLMAATCRQVQTIAELRLRPVHKILADCRTRKATAKRRVETLSDRSALHSVAGMLASRRLIATQDKCLRWSLAMAQHLALHHAYPDLVFGIRMQPFAAHAWVQAGDIVLNDSADHAMHYTPLLVI